MFFFLYHYVGYYFVTKTVVHHPVVALFPDRLTHGGSVDDWRRLAGLRKVYVCLCVFVSVCILFKKGEYVCDECLESEVSRQFHCHCEDKCHPN